jgi:hypothetical protein
MIPADHALPSAAPRQIRPHSGEFLPPRPGRSSQTRFAYRQARAGDGPIGTVAEPSMHKTPGTRARAEYSSGRCRPGIARRRRWLCGGLRIRLEPVFRGWRVVSGVAPRVRSRIRRAGLMRWIETHEENDAPPRGTVRSGVSPKSVAKGCEGFRRAKARRRRHSLDYSRRSNAGPPRPVEFGDGLRTEAARFALD